MISETFSHKIFSIPAYRPQVLLAGWVRGREIDCSAIWSSAEEIVVTFHLAKFFSSHVQVVRISVDHINRLIKKIVPVFRVSFPVLGVKPRLNN